MRGEKLTKSQRSYLQDAREAHLTAEQRALLAAAKEKVQDTSMGRAAAERGYALVVEMKGLHAAAEAAQALREWDVAAHAALVALAAAEKSFGLRDSAGTVPAAADAANRGQGGPMPRPEPARVQKSARNSFVTQAERPIADDERLARLTPDQRGLHTKACEEVRAAGKGHTANHEAYLDALADGHTSRLGPATRRREVSAKALHDAKVRLAVLRKNLGLGP